MLGDSKELINGNDIKGCQIYIELEDFTVDGDSTDVSDSFSDFLSTKNLQFNVGIL